MERGSTIEQKEANGLDFGFSAKTEKINNSPTPLLVEIQQEVFYLNSFQKFPFDFPVEPKNKRISEFLEFLSTVCYPRLV